jgi:hypothetical protein
LRQMNGTCFQIVMTGIIFGIMLQLGASWMILTRIREAEASLFFVSDR